MATTKLDYSTQLLRLADLITQMEQAFVVRDFDHLIELGNRLATDSVIAEALRRDQAPGGFDDGSGDGFDDGTSDETDRNARDSQAA